MEAWQNIYFFRSQGSSPRKCLFFGLHIHLFLDKNRLLLGGGGAKANSGEGNIEAWRGIGLSIIYMYVKKALRFNVYKLFI